MRPSSVFFVGCAALAVGSGVLAPPPAMAAFRFTDDVDPLAAARQGAPMALTASDGTGLVLVGLDAKAVIEGPLAFTELHLTFQNPSPRVLEGRFQITLPSRASVSRFAMKTDTHWQEGEVIERERARQVYEDFLHRRQDPALLEQGEANEFGARVFPIPANGRKELILSYAQPLTDAQTPYVLPLQGLSRIGTLAVDVRGGASPFSLQKKDFIPNEDISVAQNPNAPKALRHDELVAVRVQPVQSAPDADVASLLYLVDTSASRALAMERQVRLVDALTKALVDGGSANAPIAIVAFDQTSELIYRGPASGLDRKALIALRRRRAMGASDLGQALDFAAKQSGRYTRALLISDGVATAGEKECTALAKKITALSAIGVERLDAAMLGGLRDEARMAALTTAGLSSDGAVIDADRGVREVARKMARATRSKVALQIEGAEWTWPTEVSGIQPGDDVLVFARLEKGVTDVRLRVDNKRAGSVTPQTVDRPLLERAVVEAEIERLSSARDALDSAALASEKTRLKDAIVSLSTRHRVLSRFTSLLVLETAADYARYGITETALSDVLTVRGGKIVVDNSRALPKPPPVVVPVEKKPTAKKESKGKMKRRARNAPADSFGDAESSSAALEAPSDDAIGDVYSADEGGAEEYKMVASDREAEEEAPQLLGGNAERRGGGGNEAAPSVVASEAAPVPAREEQPSGPPPPPPPAPRPEPARSISRAAPRARRPPPTQGDSRPQALPAADAWTGKFADVMTAIGARKFEKALTLAQGWREEEPGDVLALVAMGRAFAAQGDKVEAARAYGSIIDLFPARADLRRFAGNLLESLDDSRALVLAAESYGEATVQRRDHPAGWRLYAFALARLGKFEEAMVALESALKVNLPGGRFSGVDQILREDLGLIASMRIRSEGGKNQSAILKRVRAAGGVVEDQPSVRFVLSWETDANDVDFHIYDAKGGHAYYGNRDLPRGGGSLYADVTTGYGPECFTVRRPAKKRVGPYRLRAHYYSRGPMGYGMGALQVIDHDGGKISIKTLPFVVMKDSAYVDLGVAK